MKKQKEHSRKNGVFFTANLRVIFALMKQDSDIVICKYFDVFQSVNVKTQKKF